MGFHTAATRPRLVTPHRTRSPLQTPVLDEVFGGAEQVGAFCSRSGMLSLNHANTTEHVRSVSATPFKGLDRGLQCILLSPRTLSILGFLTFLVYRLSAGRLFLSPHSQSIIRCLSR